MDFKYILAVNNISVLHKEVNNLTYLTINKRQIMTTEITPFSNLQRKTSVYQIFTFYKIKTLYLEHISCSRQYIHSFKIQTTICLMVYSLIHGFAIGIDKSRSTSIHYRWQLQAILSAILLPIPLFFSILFLVTIHVLHDKLIY